MAESRNDVASKKTDAKRRKPKHICNLEFEEIANDFKKLVGKKLIGENLILKVNKILTTGSASIIVHASGNTRRKNYDIPEECILKVYKIGYSCDKDYTCFLEDDYRYKDQVQSLTKTQAILLWAEKEYNNLLTLQKLRIPCPQVIALRRNILVMSFLGVYHIPAKKLSEAELTKEQWDFAYNQVIDAITSMYQKENLIIGQLDENNILWYINRCHFIDVGYGVDPGHRYAFEFLSQSCDQFFKFFRKKRVENVKSEQELFMNIVGCRRTDKDGLEKIKQKFREQYATLNGSGD